MEPVPAALPRALDENGRRLLADYLKRERRSWLRELEVLGEQLACELERARESMPDDAPRSGGDHFLWEEENREFEALAGLAGLQSDLEERLRLLRAALEEDLSS